MPSVPQQPRPIQWKAPQVGPPVKRVKAIIPAADWDKHENEIRVLYPEMTLEALMAHMKTAHNFTPDFRQYRFQFEKWKLRKNNDPGSVPMVVSPQALLQPNLDQEMKDVTVIQKSVIARPTKRQQSRQSLQSRWSSTNGGEKPPIPPKKRLKLEEFMRSKEMISKDPTSKDPTSTTTTPNVALNEPAPVDPWAQIGEVFDSSGPSQPMPRHPVSPLQMATSSGSAFSSSWGQSTVLSADAPSNPSAQTAALRGGGLFNNVGGPSGYNSVYGRWEDDNASDTSDDASDVAMLSPFSDGLNDYDADDPETWTHRPHSIGQMSYRERRLDSTRLADEFSEHDYDDMMRAADFLFSLTFDEDACSLYALTLKRPRDFPNQPTWKTSSAVILCARSAFTLHQIEIAQSLLKPKLEERLQQAERPALKVEKFLYRMLLSYTYTRHRKHNEANSEMETAMRSDIADERIFDYLPNDNRSLDILTYYFLTYGLGKHDEVSKLKTSHHHSNHRSKGHLVREKREAEERLVRRVPGPFELKDGRMQVPCIRSCLRWCISELVVLATIPDSWKHLQSNNRYLGWAEKIGIYCCFWGRWQQFRGQSTTPEILLWASRTEELMGISPAELLMTISCMIVAESPPRQNKSEEELFNQARLGARSLSRQIDQVIAHKFLENFCWVNTLAHCSPEKRAFREIARAYARDFIEKYLMIELPAVQDLNSDSDSDSGDSAETPAQSNTPRRSTSLIAAILSSPTMASSMHSSDKSLAAFRAVTDRVPRAVTAAMQNVQNAVPSNISRYSLNSNLSMQMGEFSRAFASSLSLSRSSIQQASTQALETMSTASSNMKLRIAQS